MAWTWVSTARDLMLFVLKKKKKKKKKKSVRVIVFLHV
jgi:hypothetical protein